MYGNNKSCISSSHTVTHLYNSLTPSLSTHSPNTAIVNTTTNEKGIIQKHNTTDKCYNFNKHDAFIKTDSELNSSDKSRSLYNSGLVLVAPDSRSVSVGTSETSVPRSVNPQDSVDASTLIFDSLLTVMSRRKQNKPRHLDGAESEEGEGVTVAKSVVSQQQQEDIVPNKAENSTKIAEMSSMTPKAGLMNGDVKDFDDFKANDKRPTAKIESVDLSPPFRENKLNHLPDSITPVRPYNHAALSMEGRAQIMSSSPREDSQLNGMARAYFRGLSAQENGGAFSDEDADIPSDIDSNEPSEPLGDVDMNKDTSESGFIEGSSGLKTHTDEEGTDSNRSGNSGSDDVTEDKENCGDIAQPCDGVKLQTLDTTKVAVAQVVEDKDELGADKANSAIPTIQQVLYSLHQQQMFQLQILQQIQQKIQKYSAEGDENGDIASAMGMPWLAGNFNAQTGSGASSGADDISEGSAGSFVGNDDFQDEERLIENESAGEKPEDELIDLKEDHSNRASPHNSVFPETLHTNENAQSPILPSGRPSSMPHPNRAEPFGFPRSGMLSSFMPGFNPFTPPSNPLLPSNLFNPNPLQSRLPMFRPCFPPPPAEDEDSMEEFMEIEKPESSKLEELVKKMEPTLKDPNQCAICKRILSCKSALQMHYRTHTGERPFKCKICGRAFTTKGNLKTHMSVHRTRPSGQLHHQCPVCSKQFSNVLLLQEHVRMHVGEMNKNGFPKSPLMPPLPPNYMHMMGFPPMFPPHMQPPKLSPNHEDFSKTPTDFRNEFPLRPEVKTPSKDSAGERPVLKRPAEDEETNESKKQKEAKEPESIKKEENPKPEGFSPVGKDIVKEPENVPSYGGSLLALQESVKEMDRLMHTPSHPIGIADPFLYDAPTPKERVPEHQSGDAKREKSPGRAESPSQGNPDAPHKSVITHSGTPSQTLPPTRPIVNNSVTPPSCPTSPFRHNKRESLRHVCQVCHKPFSSGSALQIHMRTHTGERPFKCTVCGKGFTTKGNLKVHMSTHACQNGPPRRGRRMSMDTLPPFGGPNKFQTLSPRPPMPVGYPGFPYPPGAFNGLLFQGKGLPSLMPPVFPGLMFDRKPNPEKDGSLSPNDTKKQTDSVENNNLQPKGMYGELDLSMRASSQPIKT